VVLSGKSGSGKTKTVKSVATKLEKVDYYKCVFVDLKGHFDARYTNLKAIEVLREIFPTGSLIDIPGIIYAKLSIYRSYWLYRKWFKPLYSTYWP